MGRLPLAPPNNIFILFKTEERQDTHWKGQETMWMKKTVNTKSFKAVWTRRVRAHIEREFIKFEREDRQAQQRVAARSLARLRMRLGTM